MVQLLSDLGTFDLFHLPGMPDLRQGVHVETNGIIKELTAAQLLALTMNEICALQGKGLCLWFPDTDNVIILFYSNKLSRKKTPY